MQVHNPDKTPPSKIPPGWRLLFTSELASPPLDARIDSGDGHHVFQHRSSAPGSKCVKSRTYITKMADRFDASKYSGFGSIVTAIKNASTNGA